jgi:hypothetical protein
VLPGKVALSNQCLPGNSKRLAIKRLTAIQLVEDVSNILAHHILAPCSARSRETGKNMVGKNMFDGKRVWESSPE